MEKFSLFLKRCFYIMFLVFPLGIGLFVATKVFIYALSGENIITLPHFVNIGFHNPVVSAVFTATVFVVCMIAIYVLVGKYRIKSEILAIGMFVSALLPRLMLFILFKSAVIPYSDGRYAWEAAQGIAPDRLKVKVLQNGWNNFTGLLRFLMKEFNIEYSFTVLLAFVFDAMIVLCIWYIAKEITGNDIVACIASIIYAFNPSLLTRPFYLSPDILSQFGVAIAGLLLIKGLKNENISKKILMYTSAGVFAGLANSIKSVSLVLVIAIFIVMIIKAIEDGYRKEQVIALILSFVCFTALSLGINKIALKGSTEILGMECKDLNTWHFINVGMYPNGGGLVSHWGGHYYNRLIVEGVEPDTARNMLFEQLKKDWSETEVTVPEFIYTKINVVWSESIQNYSKQMINSLDESKMNRIQQKSFNLMLYTMPSCCQTWYVIAMLFALIGAAYILLADINNYGAFFISLHTFGFSLMLLISEVQSRYKSNILHLLAIIAATGIWRTVSFITRNKKYTEEKEKVRS